MGRVTGSALACGVALEPWLRGVAPGDGARLSQMVGVVFDVLTAGRPRDTRLDGMLDACTLLQYTLQKTLCILSRLTQHSLMIPT